MSEVADYSVGEPPPVHVEGAPSMHDLVWTDILRIWGPTNKVAQYMRDDMKARKEFGLKKYGTILQADNGRNPLKDGYAEILDLLVYAKQAMEQGKMPATVMYKEIIELAFRWRQLIAFEEKQAQ